MFFSQKKRVIPKQEGRGPPLGKNSHIFPFFFLPTSLRNVHQNKSQHPQHIPSHPTRPFSWVKFLAWELIFVKGNFLRFSLGPCQCYNGSPTLFQIMQNTQFAIQNAASMNPIHFIRAHSHFW